MRLILELLVGFIAVQHVGIMVLEMALWRGPVGRKIFGTTQEFADASAALALNQGLYNGFLAAGLFYGLAVGDWRMVEFLVGCVLVAGIVGGLTAKRSILIVQGGPALIALILFLIG